MSKHNSYEEIIINSNRLIIGELYSYKKLCEILETQYMINTNSRKAQLKVLDSVVEYEKISTKYKIIKFRNETKEIEDNRGRSDGSRGNYQGIFKQDLLNSLLYFCVQYADSNNLYVDENEDMFNITMSKHNLMCEMGMRNKHNSYVAKVQPNNFCKELSVEKSTFDFVFAKINSNSNSAMNRILDTLKKSGLAIITEIIEITKYRKVYDERLMKFIFDKNTIESKRLATKEEIVEILHIKREVATEMNYKKESEIYATNNIEIISEFHNMVNKLTEERLGISENYPLLELNMKRSNIDRYLKKFKDISLDELLEVGNSSFLNQQKKSLKTAQTKYLSGNIGKNKLAYVQSFENYLNDSKKIANNLINIFADEIQLLDKDLKLEHSTNKFIEYQ